jgi:hypothetical protein
MQIRFGSSNMVAFQVALILELLRHPIVLADDQLVKPPLPRRALNVEDHKG